MPEPGMARPRRAGALLACLGLLLTTAVRAEPAAQTGSEPVPLAPGWQDLAFDPPPPGTYRLPPIGTCLPQALG